MFNNVQQTLTNCIASSIIEQDSFIFLYALLQTSLAITFPLFMAYDIDRCHSRPKVAAACHRCIFGLKKYFNSAISVLRHHVICFLWCRDGSWVPKCYKPFVLCLGKSICRNAVLELRNKLLFILIITILHTVYVLCSGDKLKQKNLILKLYKNRAYLFFLHQI